MADKGGRVGSQWLQEHSLVARAEQIGHQCQSQNLYQGKTPWVDQACADRPGFLVRGAGDATPPKFHSRASHCPPDLAFAFMALRANSWMCCPRLPYRPRKNGTRSTSLGSRRGHTPTLRKNLPTKQSKLVKTNLIVVLDGVVTTKGRVTGGCGLALLVFASLLALRRPEIPC